MLIQVETTRGSTLYERVGGQTFFDALVEDFYAGVQTDPILRPLYPDDLDAPKHHLALFLAQYWGGPHTYNEVRGQPRLRMRHLPFHIAQPQRDAWLSHMLAAVGTSPASDEDQAAMAAYFGSAATSLMNH